MSQVQRYIHRHRVISHPFSADGAALLVIDMQRYFTEPSSHASFPGANAIIKNIQCILSAFRERGRPVIFTRHALAKDEIAGAMSDWWGENITLENPLSAIDERVEPLGAERVIRKTRYSAFLGTKLEDVLKASGITRLVIVGVMTHLCCESTARDAFMRDYEVFFVVDATASKDEELHLGSLRALADGFAILSTTEDVQKWMRCCQ
ncbi:MAG: cysteine hydrolase [Euryarchaeota archaeon]|nr:cysteine hydrolase [Euryarchaeota archaeon]